MRKCLAVLVLLAACGDDGVHHLADAPPAPDAPNVDAATSGPVTLTVTVDGLPIVALDVYFQAANGTLVAKVATNAQGVASAVMEPGGYVTAVNPFRGLRTSDDIRTFAGVKPGDQLELHERSGTAGISVTFTAPLDSNATSYEVYSSCGYMQNLSGGGGSGSGSAPTGTISLDGCGGTADFVVQTLDGGGLPSQYFYKAGVTVTDQGVVDLSAETYTTPIPTVELIWTNVPAAYTDLNYRNVLASSRGAMFDVLDATPVTAGAATDTFGRPVVTNGISITRSHPYPTNGFARHYVLDWAPAATATVNIDLAGAELPSYSAAPSVSAATRTVTWAATGTLQPDFAWATVSASRVAAKSFTYWDWQISMPFNGTTFTFPQLPVGIDQYNLVPSDTASVSELITARVPGGYDAVRAELLSSSGPEAFAIGPTGRIVYETLETAVELRKTPPAWPLKRPTAFAH